MSAPRVLAFAWIALDDAHLCLDCEACFDRRTSAACPRCGAATVVLLTKFLQARPASATPYVSDTRRVLLADVLHHAGNGLTPARVYAQFIVKHLEHYFMEWELAGQPVQLLQIATNHARRVVAAIDTTLARLRALGAPRLEKEVPDAAAQDR